MVSLLMCDVLPSNYSEQGIWVDDESQDKFYTFFKDKNVDTCQKKWYGLLTPSIYNWFWDVYSNHIGLTTLSDEQIVILNGIFDIIKFINPTVIEILLSKDSTIKIIFLYMKKLDYASLGLRQDITFIMHGYSTVSACFHPIIPAMTHLVTTVSTTLLDGSQSS